MNRILKLEAAFRKCIIVNKKPLHFSSLLMSGDELGRGAGKGGGSGGSIRNAGGTFGKMEASNEEEYFYKLTHKQLHELKEHMEDQLEHHKMEINKHKEGIKRHQQRIDEINNLVKDNKTDD